MKIIIKILKILLITVLVAVVAIFGLNTYVVLNAKGNITDGANLSKLEKADCIIILGAAIWNGEPSPILEDRLLRGIELYNAGISDKLLVSGDHRVDDYDEVTAMKNFAISKGVPEEDIILDHSGISTYDSMYRAKEFFKAKKVVIVTQKYHLYRAVYIAKHLGLEAYGVTSDQREYTGQFQREIREVMARDKDFVKCIFKPKSEITDDQPSYTFS